mgnify:CR=1 FL=1
MSKPSWKNAPRGANYLAQDENGTYNWYEAEPYLGFMSYFGEWLTDGSYEYAGFDCDSSDWIKSLEERPHTKSKDSEYVDVKDLRGKVSIDGAYDNEPNTTVFQGMPILGHNYKNPNPLDNIQIDPVCVSQDQEFDEVENPSHYNEGRQFEVIEVLEDNICRAPDPVKGSHQWQVLRYGMRLWDKDTPLKNARKAKWYLNRLIEQLEEDEFNDNS